MTQRNEGVAYVTCHSFLEQDGNGRAIGGVETYIEYLTRLMAKRGLRVTILQQAKVPFAADIDDQRSVHSWHTLSELKETLGRLHRRAPGLVVYSDFWCVPRELLRPNVVLQHGVGWDCSYTRLRGSLLKSLNRVRTGYIRRHYLNHVYQVCKKADIVVCVDTNFRNVMQATYPNQDWSGVFAYIPNFAEIPPKDWTQKKWRSGSDLRCLFPRSYSRHRGALLFANVVKRIASRYPHVEFAFVGRGGCEAEMRTSLVGLPNVRMYSCPHSEMPKEYASAQIVVIPTTAAEGTSLSCIEAMAHNCAVITTGIGGLGNLVFPDYNGIVCRPTIDGVEAAVTHLLTHLDIAETLSLRARAVAEEAFSLQKWEERVGQIFDAAYDHNGR